MRIKKTAKKTNTLPLFIDEAHEIGERTAPFLTTEKPNTIIIYRKKCSKCNGETITDITHSPSKAVYCCFCGQQLEWGSDNE